LFTVSGQRIYKSHYKQAFRSRAASLRHIFHNLSIAETLLPNGTNSPALANFNAGFFRYVVELEVSGAAIPWLPWHCSLHWRADTLERVLNPIVGRDCFCPNMILNVREEWASRMLPPDEPIFYDLGLLFSVIVLPILSWLVGISVPRRELHRDRVENISSAVTTVFALPNVCQFMDESGAPVVSQMHAFRKVSWANVQRSSNRVRSLIESESAVGLDSQPRQRIVKDWLRYRNFLI
jgi:hypothetical protein